MSATDEIAMSIAHVDRPLDDAVEALQRNVVDVDDRHAIEIFEARAKRDDLQQVGHDLHVDAFAARALDQLQHLQVLFGRQGDVEMIDRFARHDVGRFRDGAEERQTAIAEVIARRLVVHEADDLVAELTMLEDLVRHQTSELARPGDQDSLEPDPCAPPPFEDVPYQLARRERQRDVQDEEDRPDGLRHLQLATHSDRGRREICLHVQRGDDAEDDGENAADEDGKEIVDARAAAAQPVEPLQLKAQRHEQGDERQDVDVLPQRRKALGDRDEMDDPGVEPQAVGDDESQDAEERVRDHVKGDEQTVVPIYHTAGTSSTAGGAASRQVS